MHARILPMKLKPLHKYLLLPKGPAGLIWLAVISIVLTFFIAWKLPTDPDLFWHLRAGGEILKRGIPQVDWYSHTMSNFAWIDHEYGQEIFMFYVERLGGFRLLSIVYALIITFTLTIGIKWALPKKIEWSWVLVAAPLIAIFSVNFLGTRPQMFTYLFLLLLVGLLRKIYDSNKWRLIWLTPLLFIAWANWHGSFLAGLLMLSIATFAEAIKFVLPSKIKLGPVLSLKKVVTLASVTILSGLATFVNFYGVQVWEEIIRTLGDSELHKNILEWFPPDIHNGSGFAFFTIVTLLVIALALRKNKINLTELGIYSLFMISGFFSVRNIPLFMIFAIPAILIAIRGYWPSALAVIARVWPILALLSLLVPFYVYHHVPVQKLWDFDKDPSIAVEYGGYPLGAVNFLMEHPEYNDYKAFNEYAWGGYLLSHIDIYKTFIDGRMPSWEQNDIKIIDDYLAINRQEGDWEDLLDKYKINMIITKKDHNLISSLKDSNSYKEVFSDDTAAILIKK